MISADELISLNPFPGLRAFDATEADRFFGRRQQINDLVARLDEVSFVAVAGASGCGKSSLVRAGLLSALANHAGTAWRAAVIRPGNRPIANLAEQLSPVLSPIAGSEESRIGSLYGRLRLGGLGLVEAVSLAKLDPQTRVLVVVDQFEEIFRFQRMTDPDTASAFVKLLINAAGDPRSALSVVITLRSDALGHCADFRGLPEIINRGQYLVPKLTREQRKEAIINPVEVRGFKIAPRLVQRLLNDVSDNFDDLPVMQHALARTWNHWAQVCAGSRPIDLEDYEDEAVGGAQHALSRHADEAYSSLPGLETAVERIFRSLTERVAEGTEIRRPIEYDRLCRIIGGDPAAIARVVERFRRPDTAFLMPPRDVPLSSNPVIDISHESLVRQWQRLRAWTDLETESRAMLLHVVHASRQWRAGDGSLWRERDLTKAVDWRAAAGVTPAWVEMNIGGDGADTWDLAQRFLESSAAEVRRDKRRRTLQVAWIPIFVLAIGAIAVAWSQAQRARSRELAGRAIQESERPAVSARLAAAALQEDSTNEPAEHALRQALVALHFARAETIRELHGSTSEDVYEPVQDARYSGDGTRLVTASGNVATIFDATTFERIGQPIKQAQNVLNAWLIAGNTTLVTQTTDGETTHVHVQRLENGAQPQEIACGKSDNSAFVVAVSPDEKRLAIGCIGGSVLLWNAEGDRPAEELVPRAESAGSLPVVTAVAFSADGQYLAAGDQSGGVTIWDVRRDPAAAAGGARTPAAVVQHGQSAVRDIAFHPDNPGRLVTAADDNQAMVWTVDLGRRGIAPDRTPRAPRMLNHDHVVTKARFIVRGVDRGQLFTVSGKTVRLWRLDTAEPTQVRVHDDWVTDANVSDDGQMLATASADGTARIWSTQSGTALAILHGHRDNVTRAVISPRTNQVVTASSDGTIRVWRIAPVRIMSSSSQWMLSAAFEPGGNRIAAGAEGAPGKLGTVKLLEPADKTRGVAAKSRDLPRTADPGWCDRDQVSELSWRRDKAMVVGMAGCYDIYGRQRPVLWNVATGKEATPDWLKEQKAAVFSSGTDALVTADSSRLAIWDANALTSAGAQKMTPKAIPFAGGNFTGIAVSPDGAWIAAIRNNSLALWKASEADRKPRILEGHEGSVRSIKFSFDSRHLVSASSDLTARIWSVDEAGDPKVLSGHTAAVSSAAFDPTGRRVVTGSADRTIRIWDTDRAVELAVLRWHGEAVNDVQFSADGTEILSAADDGTVAIGQCEPCNWTVRELLDHAEPLSILSRHEQDDVTRERDASKRFKWPAFLSWGR